MRNRGAMMAQIEIARSASDEGSISAGGAASLSALLFNHYTKSDRIDGIPDPYVTLRAYEIHTAS